MIFTFFYGLTFLHHLVLVACVCTVNPLTSIGTTQWHVDPMFPGGHADGECYEHENAHAQEGQLLVRKASRRVWDDLITSKKQVRKYPSKLILECIDQSRLSTGRGIGVLV